MRTITRNRFLTLSASILLYFGCALANAVPIVGSISMAGGGAVPVGVDSDGSGGITLDEATGVDFTAPGIVTGGTDDFSAIPFATFVTYNDFTFDPSMAVDPLWTFTYGGITYSFAAISFAVNAQTVNTLGITGTGMLSGTGYDDTIGGWSFSMDQASGATIFGWSSTTVPEPATMGLFGVGLLGLGLASRRRRKLP